MPIVPMRLGGIELGCVDTGSQQELRATALSHASGLADGDGRGANAWLVPPVSPTSHPL